jgi:hypothetical protein
MFRTTRPFTTVETAQAFNPQQCMQLIVLLGWAGSHCRVNTAQALLAVT